jgi:uncharacterized RDD family membrane protein YckC
MTALPIRVGDQTEERSLLTPEGVPIHLQLASASDRLAAFAIDAFIIFAGLIIVALVGIGIAEGPLAAVLDAFLFLLVNGYFIWFELRSSGRTPGKRSVGIRVLNRSGGPLRADAVIARNLTRNLEIALPLAMIVFRNSIMPGAPTSAWILGCLWLLAIALVPLFNRDRLRVGDLIAGTWVVRTPRASLLRDLARRATTAPVGPAAPAAGTKSAGHEFTPAQLDVYGIYELQALEDVLRARTQDAARLRATVADKIARKIGYESAGRLDAETFLADFYAALRAQLERKLLFGKRKEKKDR